MKRKKETSRQVFIIDKLEINAVVKDEIIEISENRYKSLKFRHTYYKSCDFMTSIDEVKEYLKSKYGHLNISEYLPS